jgi:hypothetical protein
MLYPKPLSRIFQLRRPISWPLFPVRAVFSSLPRFENVKNPPEIDTNQGNRRLDRAKIIAGEPGFGGFTMEFLNGIGFNPGDAEKAQ